MKRYCFLDWSPYSNFIISETINHLPWINAYNYLHLGHYIYEQFGDAAYVTFGALCMCTYLNSSETITIQGLMHIFTL